MHSLTSLHASAVLKEAPIVRIVQRCVSEFKCEQNRLPQLSHTLHMQPFTGQSVAMGNHQSTSKRALEGLLPRAILSTETHLTACVTECRFRDADNSVSHPLPHKRNRNSSVRGLITARKAFRGHAARILSETFQKME